MRHCLQRIAYLFSIILLPFSLLSACDAEGGEQTLTAEEHARIVEAWHHDRVNNLKAAEGWLRVAGLHWLDEGTNTFGSGADRDVQFPEGSIAAHAGEFHRDGNRVRMTVADGVTIINDGQPVSDTVIFAPDHAMDLEHGRMMWRIIQRYDLLGVRVYDDENPHLRKFGGIDRYPVDPDWRVEARFEPRPSGTTIEIINILGQVDDLASPGRLHFEIDGVEHTLDALEREDAFFIIFADETNGEGTYPGGRFLYTDLPDRQGTTYIDFNRAYNPPCALTPHSTCPMPPLQNWLRIAVPAGERRYEPEIGEERVAGY